MHFIDLQEQFRRYETAIRARMDKVFAHGRFIMGPEIEECEHRLAEFVGTKHCLTVASGTMSLEIALRALGIGAGDEVITVPFTWISSAETIRLVGAKPVFVDIEPTTFNLDPELLRASITSKTKAIMPVSLFGQMPNMEIINEIASDLGIAVIEDGAQSFGAKRNGLNCCGATTVGSTSFFPAKTLGCYGDGGALFTNDSELYEVMRAIRTHGGVQRNTHTHIGTNGRLDTLQAAILLAKLEHFPGEIEARVRIGQQYSELLSDWCTTPIVAPGNTHVYGQYTIRVKNRESVICALKDQGIPTAVYYPKCLHEQPVFTDLGYGWGDLPEAERASREVLSLPMHPFLSSEDQRLVSEALRRCVQENQVA